jgi:NitT/TauT family transport system substrate-binding protein
VLPTEAAKGNLTTVTYGSVGGMTDGPLYIADALGYFAQEGIQVKFNRFASGTQILAAMVTGDLDVGAIAVSAGLFNAVGQGDGIKFVADRQSQVGPHRFGEGFLVEKKLTDGVNLSDPKAVGEMLRGKKVAITGKNTSTELMLVDLLKTYGLQESDVEVVVLPFASMAAAFQTGAIAAAPVLEPFRSKILDAGTAVEVSHFDGVLPKGSMVPVSYSKKFASQKDLATGFMVAFLHGAMVMNRALAGDKAYHDQVVQTIAKYSDLPPETVASADPPGIDPENPLNTDYMNAFQDFMMERGVMKKKVDLDSAVDDSFAAAARAKLNIGS